VDSATLSSSSPAPSRLAPVPKARRTGWRWPVAGWFSRRYATGDSAAGALADIHPAVDIVAPRDTPVLAASSGLVTFAGWDEDLGNMVMIEHAAGITTVYGHNATLLVAAGSRVAEGQAIARLGSTGRSSAPHLHFEVRYSNRAVDPELWLSGEWRTR
jgi:murein DD-endopeptidase MepM/ murein hydrolase activator NlpD